MAVWSKLSRRIKILVGIARVLVRNPKILLINRPTPIDMSTIEQEVNIYSIIVVKFIRRAH